MGLKGVKGIILSFQRTLCSRHLARLLAKQLMKTYRKVQTLRKGKAGGLEARIDPIINSRSIII
jgi:hypothetical protein